MAESDTHVAIRGARVNNLKNLSLSFPREGTTAIVGPSGSGKSSLVFDVVLAESRRRYFGGLLALDSSSKALPIPFPPDVDEIRGLPLVLGMAMPLKAARYETLATACGLYPLLTQLSLHLGTARCVRCDTALTERSRQEFLHEIRSQAEVDSIAVLAPLGRMTEAEVLAARERLLPQGYSHVVLEGQRICWDEAYFREAFEDISFPSKAYLALDAMKFRASNFSRLAEAVELALALAEGRVELELRLEDGTTETKSFRESIDCPNCGNCQERISSLDFLYYKQEHGCCDCAGHGEILALNEESLWLSKEDRCVEKAVVPWREKGIRPAKAELEALFESCGIDRNSMATLSKRKRYQFLFGANKPSLPVNLLARTDESISPSVCSLLQKKYQNSRSETLRASIERYAERVQCQTCNGTRLAELARKRELAEYAFATLLSSSVAQAKEWIAAVRCSTAYHSYQRRVNESSIARALIGAAILAEDIVTELSALGLDYLTLGRGLSTLSSGETARVYLARELAGAMSGLMYAFDEPSASLHPVDRARVSAAIRRLTSKGSSVLMVEHQPQLIEAADFVVEMGPAAGREGGEIVWSGSAAEYAAREDTCDVAEEIATGVQGKIGDEKLQVLGASLHNLCSVDVEFASSALTAVRGVSGSGKSTLIVETLVPAVRWALSQRKLRVEEGAISFDRFQLTRLSNFSHISTLVDVTQTRERAGYRSITATLLDVLSPLRSLLAQTTPAKVLGFGAGHFSFNSKLGHCERCRGQGIEVTSLRNSHQLEIACRECEGSRFRAEVLRVTWREHSVAEILALEITQAAKLFKNIPDIASPLRCAEELGLGYLSLGQSARSLSQGEFQRIQLAAKLGNAAVMQAERAGSCLFVFDEASKGLSARETALFIGLLHRLRNLGNTVIAIEHDEQVIAASDAVIELGPGAGRKGGRVIE